MVVGYGGSMGRHYGGFIGETKIGIVFSNFSGLVDSELSLVSIVLAFVRICI